MEILLEQAIARKRAAWIGEERFGIAEASRLEMRARERNGMLSCIRRAIAEQDLRAVVAKQFVESVDEAALAIEVEAEGTQFQFIESDVGKTFQLETQGGHGVLGFDGGTQTVGGDPLHRGNFQRPESGVKAGFEFAGITIDGLRVEHRAARNGEAGAELSLLRIEVELHDGGGRNGANVMRVEHAEQGFRDFREFVVNFEMDAGSQKGEGLDEAFDVGILATVGIEQQTRGDLRIFL